MIINDITKKSEKIGDKMRNIISELAHELISMFPGGVPEEAAQDSANAYNLFPEEGLEISADDIRSEINKVEKVAKKKWIDPMGTEHDENESGLETYI